MKSWLHRTPMLVREADVATCLNFIGGVYASWGRYEEALAHYQEALAIIRKQGRKADVAACLHNIGWVYHALGKYPEAIMTTIKPNAAQPHQGCGPSKNDII